MSLQDLLLQHTIFDLRYTSSETTVHTGNTQTLKKLSAQVMEQWEALKILDLPGFL